jgi:hypothetical protein
LIQVAHFGTVNLLGIGVRYLFYIAVTANTGNIAVYGLVEKIHINVEIVKHPLFIKCTESSVFVAQQTVLRISGKNSRSKDAKKQPSSE